MNKILSAALGALALFAAHLSALAQPGPGPVPSPWIVSGNTIRYPGAVLVGSPTGGAQGSGTINVQNGFFEQGVRVRGVSSATAPLALSGGGVISIGLDANFSTVSSNLALAAGGVAYPSGVTGGAKGAGTINASGLYVSNVAVVAGGISSLTTDVVATGPGAVAATIQPGVVTYAKIQNLGALAVMARSANSSGVGADVQASAGSGAVLRESGSVIGFGTVATAGIADNAVTLAKLATQATNTVLANVTAGSAVPAALAVGSCDTATKAIGWTTNTGFVCNSSITAAAVPASGLTGTTLAANVVTSSLTTVGALAGGSATTGFTINAASVTWSGQIPGASVAVVANASGSPSATFGVFKADGTTIQCASGVCSSVGAVATSIQVGVTTITSGTDTRILRNNAGVLAEYTISGTGTVVAMATSPSFTTPTLGVASATTINKVALTAPATGSTLTIADGKTLTVSNTYTTTATDGSTIAFGAGGTVTYTVASGAKALATSAILSAACSSAQTDTATGAATTDVVDASFNADPTAVTGYVPLTAGMLTIIAYPTSNTVNFKVCNNTSSSITPGAITLNWRVRR